MPRTLTTESGAPVADNQHSASAGAYGPLLLQDQHLLEKLARFNRERIPERVVHARGSGAYGYFEVTDDVSRYTRAAFLAQVGKRTEVFLRFSTVAGALGSTDAVRDPRGFAVKFYTEQGNYDLVGNNTPVFFIKDPLKFPDFIHSQKRDPYTGTQEADNVWDFWAHSPASTHQITWLFGDRGIPASYRHMNGYGSHTYQWVNAEGRAHWVKYHFKTNQGVRSLDAAQAAEAAGGDADSHQRDLHQAIERGVHPSWTLYVQLMPVEDAADYRFNPFDLTKVWPHADHPLVKVGRLVLNRNPENVFAEVEQAAFSPNNFVPGIGPSPDRMLQGRLFAYADAQRYRLGVNHTQLPVNAPRAAEAAHYGQDGLGALNPNGREKNYEPNSYGGPAQTDEPLHAPQPLSGHTGTYPVPAHSKDDDFFQAGELYRLMTDAEKSRLIANLAGSLARVGRDDVVEKNLAHFHAADPEYGARLAAAVTALRESHED
ncbi:catalase [Kitasatospora phosalacinea]|uniref:Catalase n=1 Tax=Kitasatospora phosalacinea TaxID=2065 RepID=A0A9W6PEX3_9ACTN|nr:catalase [Kitasatospora phosalacinea]GLW53693.1 catalase [Kitasatospora phosalacinea]